MSPSHPPLSKPIKVSLHLTLASSLLMTTACGVGGYGIGRNPLGGDARRIVTQVAKDVVSRNFTGNPEQLRALFLRSTVRGQLKVGETFPLKLLLSIVRAA